VLSILNKQWDSYLTGIVAETLGALAPRVDVAHIPRAWDSLIDLRSKTANGSTINRVRSVLSTVSHRFDITQVASVGDELLVRIGESTDERTLETTFEALEVIAPRLTEPQAGRTGKSLLKLLGTIKEDEFPFYEVCSVLIEAAPRLDSTQLTPVWERLMDRLSKEPNSEWLLYCLRTLAPHLNSAQVNQAFSALHDQLKTTDKNEVLDSTSEVVEALAARLDLPQCSQLIEMLLLQFDKPRARFALTSAGNALLALSLRLDVSHVTQLCNALLVRIHMTSDSEAREVMIYMLTELAPRLDATEAGRARDLMFEVLQKPTVYVTDRDVQKQAGKALVALTLRLKDSDISRACDTLIDVIQKTQDYVVRKVAFEALVVLAPQLDAAQIDRAWNSMFKVLASTEWYFAAMAGDVLVALAPSVSPEERIRAAESMLASLRRSESGWMAEPLRELLPHLDSLQRSRIAREMQVILQGKLSMSSTYFYDDAHGRNFEAMRLAARAFEDPKALAEFLRHPACAGEPREYLLQRFEELVFHNGQAVILTDPPAEETDSAVKSDKASSPPEPPPRRFHSIHDAAAWIQKDWPDFDLETTLPVTWQDQ